jgi:FkbH-like protein
MDEQRAREILAAELKIKPEEVDDGTDNKRYPDWDSLTLMNLTFALEAEGTRLTEEQIIGLTSWPAIRALVRPIYKALVLDADNTLWAGVAGEGKIVPFPNVQQTYLDLKNRGVLLALASRNDTDSLYQAFADSRSEMLPEDFVTISKEGANKVEALKQIAAMLNIGLDAIVFVDDSEFECEAVRQQLPEVKVVHAPPKIALDVAKEVVALFPEFVDTAKTAQYHALAQAKAERPKFATEEEFLTSLGIVVGIRHNHREDAARIAELTQKSNQFNVTTKRYTAKDIVALIDSKYSVWALTYRDRFGDQGIVGVIIQVGHHIEEFCLSCRVLGRGVEFAPWEFIMDGEVRAEYIRTPKNAQVAGFWGAMGLGLIEKNDTHKLYEGHVNSSCPSWIRVI